MRLTYYQRIVIKYGIEVMRQLGGFTVWLNRGSIERPLRLLITGCVVLGFLLGGACANGDISQPTVNPEETSGETDATAGSTSPITPEPPVEPLPSPSITATTDQANQESSQPPPDSNPPTVISLDATTLITRQASQMTLTLADMGPGWAQGSAVAPAKQQVTSFSNVYYTQGSSYAPGVQNTVAVYRSISAAENAFAQEKQSNPSASGPRIGNECLLNDSAPINKLLVFRKNNVVVWLWLQQYKAGDIERYARIVEQRITASSTVPISPDQSSQTSSTPSQQTPVETPADIGPAITKPADGLVTKQAYEMVLTKQDMATGWVQVNISPPANRQSSSSCSVCYSQGSSFAPTVQNTVSVYRDVESAVDAYTGAKPSGASLLYPDIGDECFLNNSVAIDRLLIFRTGNVVVWIWLKQYKTGDIEAYARTVENKIIP